MNHEFLKLSWEIQLAVASGYAAYVLAYTGLRDRHRPIDVVFISVVFSLIATLVLWLLAPHGPLVAGSAAFAASVVSGIVWRALLRPLVFKALRLFNVTWADDEPSALATLSSNNKHRVSQIAILLDDGSWLECEQTHQFANSPFGPAQIGPNGDVALYVTKITLPDGKEKTLTSTKDVTYGDRITYVPASKIRRMTLRYAPNRPWPVEASSRSSEAEQAAPSATP